MFLPKLLWNVQHDFPCLELMRNIKASGRDTVFTPLGYLKPQIFVMTPVTFSAWLLGGAPYFFFWDQGQAVSRAGLGIRHRAGGADSGGDVGALALFLPVLSSEAFLRYQASLPFSI